MSSQDLTPPEPSDSFIDHAKSSFNTLMEDVPIYGFIAKQVALVAKRRSEKQWFNWANKMAKEIESLGFSAEAFAERMEKNEKAIEILELATREATVTSEAEKVEALKNAVINSALDASSTIAKEKIFLTYLRDFSGLHLRILKIFQNPDKEFVEQGKADYARQTRFGGYDQILKHLLPAFSDEPDLCEKIVNVLHDEKLLTISSVRDDLKKQGRTTTSKIPDIWIESIEIADKNYLTKLGNEFLAFISPPKFESK